ncbi:uncharacterized protein LOC143181491 [Calliopsis andreniformis]|uniref:uncharacterized protein LOC143181491 n=1 Tax=Calliopsis andreniformis TaxID=337506 RepID=UPI003FCC7332
MLLALESPLLRRCSPRSTFLLGSRRDSFRHFLHLYSLLTRELLAFPRGTRYQEDQDRGRPGEPLLGGDGRVQGLRLRGGETAQLEEEAKQRPQGHREAHVLQVLQELHSRVALEEAHQVRVRPRAEGPVSLLCCQDETAWPRVQTYPTVPSGPERLRDRSELRSVGSRSETVVDSQPRVVSSCSVWRTLPLRWFVR